LNEHLLRKIVSATVISVLLLTSSAISFALPATVSLAAVTGNITLQTPPPKGNPKLDSALSLLASQNSTASIGPLTSGIAPQTAAGTVRVIIEAAAGQTNNVTSAAGALGTIEGKYGNLVQMVVPVSRLSALAQLPSSKFVRLPNRPLPAIVRLPSHFNIPYFC
jgi:hypothetical protein